MERNNTGIYVTLGVILILIIAGFFFVFNSLGTLRTDVRNLEMALELANKERQATIIVQEPKEKTPETKETTSTPEKNPEIKILSTVPTAILMDVLPSAASPSQSKVTVSVESIDKNSDGTTSLSFKIYTNKATGNSSIDPIRIFGIVSMDSDNIQPFRVTGQFSSIPPKSVAPGSVFFRISEGQSTFILQVGFGENVKFYEIDFFKKTYKETVIG
jgi:hypothetical protein